jgi:hypothetical protein
MVTTTQSNLSIMSTATKVNLAMNGDKKSEKGKKRNFFKRLLPQVTTETEGSIQQLHAIQMII